MGVDIWTKKMDFLYFINSQRIYFLALERQNMAPTIQQPVELINTV